MGQRPTAFLFRDHFYGFRDWVSGLPEVSGTDVHWSSWDFALADAISFIKDHTNQHGHLVFEYEDQERVDVKIEKRIDRHNAAVESRTSGKKYKAADGEYFVSRLELYPWVEEQGGTWPTASEWYEAQDKLLGIHVED